ncbi:hypothetical protein F8158_20660 [Bacillus cereus]|uniref:Anthrax toxin edema factor central domain-containing protein n=1 Tax=Bacillus cereus TaxID=1396 RepID=A0AB34D5T7_BACCE|nr:anthrax toxin-like adenylyl cyclase domain-containing protein [Bacillus cereus]KAB2494314.1 hypothetical protein F8158_20660 [Bacillus cereus]
MINKKNLTKLILSLGVAASGAVYFGNIDVQADRNFTREKNEKILDGITVLKGDDAINDSGLVPEHVTEFKKLAHQKNMYILFMPVNKLSTNLIKNGAATKAMSVHGKSSDWGPMGGYVPYDANLSKVYGNAAQVKIGNEDNEDTLSKHQEEISKINLEITNNRIKELTKENIINNPFDSQGLSGNDENGKWLEIDIPKNYKGSSEYQFRIYSKDEIIDSPNQIYEVRYKNIKNSKDKFKPVEVMAKIVDGRPTPLTADYDIFGIFQSLESLIEDNPEFSNTLQEAHKEPNLLKKWRFINNALIQYGLERETDAHRHKNWNDAWLLPKNEIMQAMPHWHIEILDQINKAAMKAGYTGGTVANHATELENVRLPQIALHIFVISPDGATFSTTSWEGTQQLIRNIFASGDYLLYTNRSYNIIASEKNKAQIEALDKMPNDSVFYKELYTLKKNTGTFIAESDTESIWENISDLANSLKNYYSRANLFLATDLGKTMEYILGKKQALKWGEEQVVHLALFHGVKGMNIATKIINQMTQLIDEKKQLIQKGSLEKRELDTLAQQKTAYEKYKTYFEMLLKRMETQIHSELNAEQLSVTVKELLQRLDFNKSEDEGFLEFIKILGNK